MSFVKQDAERCLNLLREYYSLTGDPQDRLAYERAFSNLRGYLTDETTSLPCQAKDGHQDERIRTVELLLQKEERLGIILESLDANGWSTRYCSSKPTVISILHPRGAAAKDGRLARGDLVLSINGHSLSQVSLQRAK